MDTSWVNNGVKKLKYDKLSCDLQSDVVIVGGGMAGVISAYLLVKEGKKVILLEANELGSGATLRTTAFITQAIDTSLANLKDMFGEETTKLVWQSGNEAVSEIERIIRQEHIECEFTRCSGYEFANTERQFYELKEEAILSRQYGFDTELYYHNHIGFKNSGYLEIKNQAKFHPGKFLFALAQKTSEAGVSIFEHTKVTNIKGGGPVAVQTDRGIVTAGNVIIATYQPFGNPKKTRFKKGMYVSYVLELSIPTGIIPEAMYWDFNSPYHYFRVDRNKDGKSDRLIIGGADHRAELPINLEKKTGHLEKFLRGILGENIELKIIRRWLGPILEPSDGLALIGRIHPRYFVASAFSGNGMTYAAIAAMMFRDILSGKENPYEKIYDPLRTPTIKQLYIKGKDYIKEFFGGAVRGFFKK